MRRCASSPPSPASCSASAARRRLTRTDVDRKIGVAADFYNEVGKRGKKAGVPVAFHPHSHHGSIFESRQEYDRIMKLTDPETVEWNPDTGHIVRGGQDLLDTLRRYGARIIHVHLKDADPQNHWQPLGKGVCDIPAVLKFLEERDRLCTAGSSARRSRRRPTRTRTPPSAGTAST